MSNVATTFPTRAYSGLLRVLVKVPKVVLSTDEDYENDIARQIIAISQPLGRLDDLEAVEEHVPGFGLALVNAISSAARSSVGSTLLSAVLDAGALLTSCQQLALALVCGDIFAVLARSCVHVTARTQPDIAVSASGSGHLVGTAVGSRSTNVGGSGGSGAAGLSAGGFALNVSRTQAALKDLSCYCDAFEFVMTHLGVASGGEEDVWDAVEGALRRSSFLEHGAAALLRTAADINRLEPEQEKLQPHAMVQQQEALWLAHSAAAARFLVSVLHVMMVTELSFDELCASNRRYQLAHAMKDSVFYLEYQAYYAMELRGLVSGPCLRTLLLASLLYDTGRDGDEEPAAERPLRLQPQPQPQPLRAGGTRDWLLRMRWPGKVSNGVRDVAAEEVISNALQVSARVFQATVSGRHGAVPVAQPPVGYVNPGSGSCRDLEQEQEGKQEGQKQELEGKQEAQQQEKQEGKEPGDETGRSVRTVPIFCGVAAGYCTLRRILQGQSAAGSSGANRSSGLWGTAGTWPCTLPALRLLARLLPELGPRHAAAELPELWRLLVAALPRLLEPHVAEEDALGLLADAGLLLRLQLDGRGKLLPLVPHQQQQQQQQQAPSAPAAAGVWCFEATGQRGGCSGLTLSLRCALDAGLLPALERLLRAACVEVARREVLDEHAATGLKTHEQPAGMAVCAVGCLLVASGVFPALLAHGLVAEVVSLLATLKRGLGASIGVGVLRRIPAFETVAPSAAAHVAQGFLVSDQWLGLLLMLAQQARAALALGATGAAAPSEFAAGAATAPSSCPQQHELPQLLSSLLHPWARGLRVDARWLAAAGGAPPAGTPAAAQQRQLHALMCLWWTPEMVLPMPGTLQLLRDVCDDISGDMGEYLRLALRQVLELVQTQLRVCQACARAYVACEVARQAQAPGAACGASGTGGSSDGQLGAKAAHIDMEDGDPAAVQAVQAAGLWAEAVRAEWRWRFISELKNNVYVLCHMALSLMSSDRALAAKVEAVKACARGAEAAAVTAAGSWSDSCAGAAAGSSTTSGAVDTCCSRDATSATCQILQDTGSALLDLLEQYALCAALYQRDAQVAATTVPAAAATHANGATAAEGHRHPLLMTPATGTVLQAAAAQLALPHNTRELLTGLEERPGLQGLLLVLQSEGDGSMSTWACPFLPLGEKTGQQVTAEQLQAAEAAAQRLVDAALAEYTEQVGVATAMLEVEVAPAGVPMHPALGRRRRQQRQRLGQVDPDGLPTSPVAERLACSLLQWSAARVLADTAARQRHTNSTLATDAGSAVVSQVAEEEEDLTQTMAKKVCGDPMCRNLQGGSALLPVLAKTCARCKAVSYCSGECQLAHWGGRGGHAQACPVLRAAMEASGLPRL